MNLDIIPVNEVKFVLIAPYPKLAEIFKPIAIRQGLDPYIAFAEWKEAATLAKQIESTTDVFLSRGGAAIEIRKVTEVPVMAIPVTPFDVLKAITKVNYRDKKIAFFNFQQKMHGIDDAEKIIDKKIHEYTFTTEQELEHEMLTAMEKGQNLFIGGNPILRLAKKYGQEGILVECGEQAIYHSILEALHVVQVRKTERRRTASFGAALNSIAEGVIVTNEQNRITIYNPAAERIFRLSPSSVIGEPEQAVIPQIATDSVVKSVQPQMASLIKVNNETVVVNRIPIHLDGRIIGIVSTLENAAKVQHLEQKIRTQIHAKGFIAKHSFNDILTASQKIAELKKIAAAYASTDSTILIEGESGTGKELFAQSIHNASKRSHGPFVAVNCATIPENLLESELFGYDGGAFSGAKKEGKQGLFELAHNGTIFLDELGEIPLSLQARLLRVLQEKEIMHVGGNKIIPVDIRIISATNVNIEKNVTLGKFRRDLYFRLNVFNLKLPRLSDRKEDIILLAKDFLKKFGTLVDDDIIVKLTPLLLMHDWPGNIRELQNSMERFSLLSEHFPDQCYIELMQKNSYEPTNENEAIIIKVNVNKGLKQALGQAEKTIIEVMLSQNNFDRQLVAKLLGIGRTSLWRKQL